MQDSDTALTALGDMPLVPLAHFQSVCMTVSPAMPIAVRYSDAGAMVSVAFSANFPQLRALRGVRELLRARMPVGIDPALPIDKNENVS